MPLLSNREFNILMHLVLFDWLSHAAFRWERHLTQAVILFLYLPPFSTEDRAAQSLLNKLIRSNLVDTTNQVEVLQRDPTSPLYSVKSFEELRL